MVVSSYEEHLLKQGINSKKGKLLLELERVKWNRYSIRKSFAKTCFYSSKLVENFPLANKIVLVLVLLLTLIVKLPSIIPCFVFCNFVTVSLLELSEIVLAYVTPSESV